MIYENRKILFVVAHGESWQLVASVAISNLVKKVLEENNSKKGQSEETGTFELRYTPADEQRKPIIVPLSPSSTPTLRWSDHSKENGGQRNTNPYSIMHF